MARVCQVTGKRTVTGNKVSHSNIKTKRRFLPNLHSKRLWLESEQRFVRLRVSANGLRTIDKLGVEAIVGALRANGSNI
jgi:large subunit ribosomal protein L28